MELAACILAAGDGQRMGTPKASLEIGGRTYLQFLLEAFRAAGITALFVAARDPATHAPVCDAIGARLLVNPHPERGMLSSLHVCLEEVRNLPDVAGLFMTPVDCPLVRATTIVRLATAFETTNSPVVVPRHANRRGHPVLFAARVFDELRSAPLDRGARVVVGAHSSDLFEVEVTDAGILDDVDTPADAARLANTFLLQRKR